MAEAPIFVVGTGRSGTTLLRMVLSAHPRIYLTHEASFCLLESIYPARRTAEEFLRFYFASAPFRWLRLDPRELMAGVPRPVTRDGLGAVFSRAMALKAAQFGKARFGDKTPSHSGNLGRIFELWPDARVVRIVRDPRAVVQSLRRMPWAPGSIIGAAAMCEIERRQVAPFSERILKVRLEDLLAAPRAEMERILEFVGEPWSEQVLDHSQFGPGEDDLPPVPWFALASRPISGPRPASWRTWDPVELRLVEWLTRDCMAEDGYARADEAELAGKAGRAALFGRWFRELPRALSELGTGAAALRVSRRDAGRTGAETMKTLRRLNPEACDGYPGFEMPDPPALPQGWEAALAPVMGRLANTQ